MKRRQIIFSLQEIISRNLSAQEIGGKGYGLAIMKNLGIPVPDAFVISTTASRAYNQTNVLPKRFGEQLNRELEALEKRTGKKFGSNTNPLILSIRSGAPVSMPGMMDTVLNVGLSQEMAEFEFQNSGSLFLWESYIRFLLQYSLIVLGLPEHKIEKFKKAMKKLLRNHIYPNFLKKFFWRRLTNQIHMFIGEDYIPSQHEQIVKCIIGVLDSWNGERADLYRSSNGIDQTVGTAVIVQEMVFGNRDSNSCSGVVFSRNISDGSEGLYGEFLQTSQGESVVNGSSKPKQIETIDGHIFKELSDFVLKLDGYFKDIVDVEFTVESGKLFLLQVRKAKRSALAMVVNSVDRVRKRQWTKEEVIAQLGHSEIDSIYSIKDSLSTEILENLWRYDHRKGIPASPGVITGVAAFNLKEVTQFLTERKSVIFVREKTDPSDLKAMLRVNGILTTKGGNSSHAALIAREKNIPAVVGVESLSIVSSKASSPGFVFRSGDEITIDGTNGLVFKGVVPVCVSNTEKSLETFLKWIGGTKKSPSIDFSALANTYSINKFLNDFYISRALLEESKGTQLWLDIFKVHERIVDEIAGVMALYVLLAVSGEIRHIKDSFIYLKKKYKKKVLWLKNKLGYWDYADNSFGLSPYCNRSKAQDSVITYFKDKNINEVIEFLDTVIYLFNSPNWSPSFGGPKWAAIAESLKSFLTGRISKAIFVDHGFDLEHNGGSLFDKHDMFTSQSASRILQYQLKIKFEKNGAHDLFRFLTKECALIDKELSDLYRKGGEQGLWTKKKEVVHA